MKNFRTYFYFLLFFWGGNSLALAHPFHGNRVCIPPIDPNAGNLEFRIRDGGACEPQEQWMQVGHNAQGVTLLTPAQIEDPLTPQQTEDLERVKKFYGGEEEAKSPH